jgi:hypothetical protein
MKEQAYQQSGCTDQSCAVKLGNILNVQKIAAGSVTRLGSKHIISVNLIDVERAQVELGEKFSVDAIEDILQNITVLAQRLGERAQVFGTLMKQSDGNTWLVNLGHNDTVRVGQKLLVMRYGKAIVNQATGELMGRETRDLGELTVLRVDPSGEFSTVKPASPDVKEGDRVYLPAGGKTQEYTTTTTTGPAKSTTTTRSTTTETRQPRKDDVTSMIGLEAMIKTRQFMKNDQRPIALALARNLPQTTRMSLLSQKKMSPAPYFVANFFIFSLGSWIQGDRVAGGVTVGGVLLGSALASVGTGFFDFGLLGAGTAVLLTAAVANYGGPFIFANKYNKALGETLSAFDVPRAVPVGGLARASAGVTFQIPVYYGTF